MTSESTQVYLIGSHTHTDSVRALVDMNRPSSLCACGVILDTNWSPTSLKDLAIKFHLILTGSHQTTIYKVPFSQNMTQPLKLTTPFGDEL